MQRQEFYERLGYERLDFGNVEIDMAHNWRYDMRNNAWLLSAGLVKLVWGSNNTRELMDQWYTWEKNKGQYIHDLESYENK